MLYKNVTGQKIAVFAYTASTGAAKTGDAAQITSYLSIDFAAAGAVTDTNPTEMDATNMPGWYVFDLSQAETNGNVLVFAPKSSTSGVVLDQVQVFTTASIDQTGDAYAVVNNGTYGNSALEALVDDLETLAAAIKAKTDNLPTDPADDSDIDSQLAAIAAYIDTEVASILAAVDTEVAAIKAKTDNLPSDPADESQIQAAIAAVQSDTNDIQTRLPAALVGGRMDSSTGSMANGTITAAAIATDAIDADAIAADAVTEIQAGLATSAQVSAIGSGTGAALNFAVDADNASAPLNGVTAIGTPTGTFTNTLANDASVHSILSVNSTSWKIDWVYGFSVGAGRSATKIIVRAAMAATGDTVTFKLYNFLTTNWDTRTTITGTASQLLDIPALSGHTGTGADAGKVYLRIVYDDTDTGTININEVYCSAQQSGSLVGYQDALIWVDTNGSNTDTVPYVDGTADNPVSTIAAAYTLATATGLKGIRFLSGSSVTLTQSAANWRFVGSATIALNGQSIADAVFRDSYTISGTSTGDDAEFINCGIGTATIAHAYFIDCRFKGTLTMAASNEYFITGGYDAVSSGTCTFVFAASAELMVRDWHGGIQLNSMATGNTAIIDGAGRVVIDGSSTGGAVTIRGMFAEATGASTFVTAGGTITDTARWAEDQNVTNVTGTVVTVTTLTNLPAVTTDWLSAGGVSAAAVTKIQTGLSTVTTAQVNAEVVDVLRTDTLPDSYAADAAQPTFAQAVLEILQFLTEKAVVGTTVTVNKPDGSSAAMTFTLDSATAPTAITRAT